jgi:hypothetical protein
MQAIAKLVKTVAALMAAAVLVNEHVETGAQLEDLESLLSKVATEETLTNPGWDLFSAEMRNLFRTPIEIGIDGAEDDLAALEKLAIRGKDTIDTGFRYERCVQAYHRRLWESERGRQVIEVASREPERLCKQQPPSLRMMMFYEH